MVPRPFSPALRRARTRVRPAFITFPLAAALVLIAGALPAHAAGRVPARPRGPLSSVGGAELATDGVVAGTAPGIATPPSVDLGSYVVADATTGRILAAKAPHWRLYPASTQKMLMALSVMPLLKPGQKLVATSHDQAPEPDGSAVGIVPGQTYTVADLWHGVFLRSGNDAVEMLANHTGGVPHVLTLMRAEAKKLGANDTTVVDTDGYDARGQLSSAYDLTLMARAGLANPQFRSYCDMRSASFPGKGHASFQLDTENKLMGMMPDVIGVKNGYTTLAGHTFVGAVTSGGHTVIVTAMRGGLDIYEKTAQLMGWGLKADGHVSAVGQLIPQRQPAAAKPVVAKDAAAPGPAHHAARPSSDDGVPAWGWAAIGAGAVLVMGIAVVDARRRRRGERY